jgi:hypothetical protein
MDHGDAVGQAAALAPLGRQVRREQLDVLGPRWSVRRFARAHVVLWQRSLLTTPRHTPAEDEKMRKFSYLCGGGRTDCHSSRARRVYSALRSVSAVLITFTAHSTTVLGSPVCSSISSLEYFLFLFISK